MKTRLLCIVVTAGWFIANLGWVAQPFAEPAKGGLPQCQANLSVCSTDLTVCSAALATCEANAQRFPATGQTTCWETQGLSPQPPIPCAGTGQDGDMQAGAALSYTDNGDGTITDNNTKLMWEKKDKSGGIHNQFDIYTFAAAFGFIDTLNTTCDGEGITACAADNDCGAGEVCGFAGYRDWRVPNVKELQSIVNYETSAGGLPQAVSAEFNSACVAGCTLTECSCTANSRYWSSTTFGSTVAAFIVSFVQGNVHDVGKRSEDHVRAVRGD